MRRDSIIRFALISSISLMIFFLPSTGVAQYSDRQCINLLRKINAALMEQAYKRLIILARENLTFCKNTMRPEENITGLSTLAAALNFDGQHSEALAVANLCLQTNAASLECAGDKANALIELKRLREAKKAVEEALNYPAITAFDAISKRQLRDRLAYINNKLQSQPSENRVEGNGSAFYVSAAGHLVTNAHVVKDCRSLAASNGSPLQLIKQDLPLDLALVQATGIGPAGVGAFRERDAVLGESIIVFGFPLGGLLARAGNVTSGIVSATSGFRDNPRNLQITAPVQPGNSGGPLLDQFGNVLGVVVAKLDAIKAANVTGDIPQNVNFAIKGREIVSFLNQAGVSAVLSKASTPRTTEAVAASAASFTVRMTCFR
jgi:S1-C subfamily serine protease